MRIIHLTAPSRLHFGLLSFNEPSVRQFGGCGMMITEPRLEFSCETAEHFHAIGVHSERIVEFANRWMLHHNLPELPRCQLRVTSAPPQHVGLGVGTQLGMSVAKILNTFSNRCENDPRELAKSVGRGQRSAIGTYGFVDGGFLYERGKLPSESISVLENRISVPREWRIVLIRPVEKVGLSGDKEARAFRDLPAVNREVTKELTRLLVNEIMPAMSSSDFPRFSEAIFDYGSLAGSCFSCLQQSGSFATDELSDIVDAVRSHGASGIGQSSWGPTLFAFQPDQTAATTLANWVRNNLSAIASPLEVHISAPNNSGAIIQER